MYTSIYCVRSQLPMPTLEIFLLDGFRVQRDGAVVTAFESARTRALLAYLALEADKPHTREELAALLWSERLDRTARRNLSQALNNLQSAIHNRDAQPPFLLVTPNDIQFNRASDVWVDVWEFQQGASRGESEAALQAAIALYRGELLSEFFLSESPLFEEWLLLTREKFHQAAIGALTQLLRHHEGRGADGYTDTITTALRLLELEQWREVAHRALMRALALRGEPNAALAAYERCRAILAAELGVEPEPDTRTLAEQIRQGKVELLALPHVPRHNLPAPLSLFIGRKAEVTQVQALITESKYRLVTLVGVGGIGKTRLSQQAASRVVESFKDGVWLAEFASLHNPALVPQEVARALGVPESNSYVLLETLCAFVREKTMLLVLDNCEHLIAACAHVAERLLRVAPKLQVLVTSREPLGLTGEVLYRVPPLQLPTSENELAPDELAGLESVRLFVERVRAVQPQFQLTRANAHAVAQICRRLDGIPLALELAAARGNLLSPQEIAARLDSRFELLTGGSRMALPQHQTLRALIDWSFDLLSEEERVLFRRLSIFAGGWTLEAVEQVCYGEQDASDPSDNALAALTGLTNLVSKSLVVTVAHDHETRYTMLETIRDYARNKLQAAGEQAALQARHYEYFYRRACEIAPRLEGREPQQWLDRLEQDHDNLRAAFAWAVQTEPVKALFLAGALSNYLEWRGYLTEALEIVEQALARCQPEERAARLEGTKTATTFARRLGYLRRAIELAHAGLELCGEMQSDAVRVFFLNALGVIYLVQWRVDLSRPYLEECLALRQQSGSTVGLAAALLNMGQMTARLGDFQAGAQYIEQAIQVAAQSGTTSELGLAWYSYAVLGRLEGEYRLARERIETSIAICKQIGYKWGIGLTYCERVTIAVLDHSEREADEYLAQCLQVSRQIGGMTLYLTEPTLISHYANKQNNPSRAVRLLSAAKAARAYYDMQYTPAGSVAIEQAITQARSQLDAETFRHEWENGRQLTLEELLEQSI